jgi:AraC-like DNA-binding protein
MARQGAGHVRYLMGKLRAEELSTLAVAQELGLSERRVRQLYREYLACCAENRAEEWAPGKSGGHNSSAIPELVTALWCKMLGARPPAPYAFCASEALRLYQFRADRATVRRWALQRACAHTARSQRPDSGAIRRWQCAEVGALWQLDATPHRWFGEDQELFPLLDMVDDCSRVIVGARLYPRECLLAYVDFLPRAFEEYGFPLALYVDYHSFFFSKIPDNLTYLAEALRRYDVTLKYAPTAQAKGKIERQHQFWQNRLPSFFATHGIGQIAAANPPLEDLRQHHNAEEVHRELQMTPHLAWRKAKRDGRCLLRPCRKDPWWKYIWSVRFVPSQ